MAVELGNLRWALVASQHRSLRQGAETLNIRQSTLSRGLRDLEYQLGSTLFERTSGGTRSTVAGQEFLDAAKRIVEETEAITARLRNRSRGKSGELMIGAHASLSVGNLRATLIDHRHRFPDVQTHLLDGSSDHLIFDLASSTIDIAFVAGDLPGWDDKSLSIWSERVVVALPEDDPLTSRDIVHWSELRHEPLLLPQRGAGSEFLKLLIGKGDFMIPAVFCATMLGWIGFQLWPEPVGASSWRWKVRLERPIRELPIGRCMKRTDQLALPSARTGARRTAPPPGGHFRGSVPISFNMGM